MAKFCTKCGKPLKDGKPCDCEKNKKEEVNTNNIGENIKDGYYIDDHNIYPILSSVKVNTKYDIDTAITGNKKSELGEDYTYTCEYSVVDGNNGDTPDPGEDPGDNPEEYMNYYYRTISLNDVFPDHRGSKRPYNWRYIEIEKEIEANANRTYASMPEYMVTLSPSNMRDIRKYNLGKEKDGGYLDYSLDCRVVGGKRECESVFLNNIVSDNYATNFTRNRS